MQCIIRQRRFFFLSLLFFGAAWCSLVHAEEPLPVAQTVTVLGENRSTGAVVRYDDVSDGYFTTTEAGDVSVYGVIAERPAIVFVTATSAIPVVTNGVANVQVSDSNGAISRGDLLMSGEVPGVAVRATTTDDGVFAVALANPDSSTGLVIADVSVVRAEAYQVRLQERDIRQQQSSETTKPPIVRLVIATSLVLIAVIFLLYSYRTILNSGVISIGRNPRARRSVVYVTIGSTAFAIVIALLVVLVALGIVVVPLS